MPVDSGDLGVKAILASEGSLGQQLWPLLFSFCEYLLGELHSQNYWWKKGMKDICRWLCVGVCVPGVFILEVSTWPPRKSGVDKKSTEGTHATSRCLYAQASSCWKFCLRWKTSRTLNEKGFSRLHDGMKHRYLQTCHPSSKTRLPQAGNRTGWKVEAPRLLAPTPGSRAVTGSCYYTPRAFS